MIFDEIDAATAKIYRRFIIQTLLMHGVTPQDSCSDLELLEWCGHFPGASDWERFMAWGRSLGHTIYPRPQTVSLISGTPTKGIIKFRDYRNRVQELHAALTEVKPKDPR